ncbi:MAG: endonuclease/exonuclease/phosphatase family protein [Stackebrandtia sp.]
MRHKILGFTLAAATALAAGAATYAAQSAEAEPSAAEAVELRAMTYNIKHGYDYDDDWDETDPDLDRTAEAIAEQNPDVVALQEINNNHRLGNCVNQTEELADKVEQKIEEMHGEVVEMHWAFENNQPDDASDNGCGQPKEAGNAVLSKHEIVDQGHLALERNTDVEGARRGLMWATVDAGGTPVRVYSTHLASPVSPDAQQLREDQTRQALAEIGDVDTPTLFMGDFNSKPENPNTDTPMPAELAVNHGFADSWAQVGPGNGYTVPVDPDRDPDKRIDYVFASPGFDILRATKPRTLASDHYPVRVVVSFNPQ